MLLYPTVNSASFKDVKDKIKKASDLKFKWIQIDVSDGKFTKAKSWNNPKALFGWMSKEGLAGINLEIHLMVINPMKEIIKWKEIGAKRFFIHAEVLNEEKVKIIEAFAKLAKIEIGIAINPDTPIKNVEHYLRHFKLVQFLAVKPGYSGQKFDKRIIKKIEYTKKNYPKIKIEVDGGMNEKTLPLVKAAGADYAVSGTYIYEVKNVREVIRKYK